jgi:copper transport protein
MRRWTILGALLLALLACIGAAAPAHAHATLVSSEPAEGAILPAAPPRLILTFNEPVSPLVVRLVTATGVTIALEATAEREASLAVALPSGLAAGTHVLSWRVISLDGHPVGGTVAFSVGAPSAGPGPVHGTADPRVAAALWALRIVLYAGLFVGAGGSFFLAWFAPYGAVGWHRRVIALALAAGLVATPVLVGLQGADALELPLTGLAGRAAWRTGFGTSFGMTAIGAALAMLAGALALTGHSRSAARGLSLLGIAAAGIALALSGHASSAAPRWLTRPAVFVHTVSLTLWLGALVPLGAVLLAKDAAAAVTLARFSRFIPLAIAPLIASGVVLVVVQVEHPHGLLATTYGVVLCAKLALMALLLAVAAWNRVRLTPAVMDGGAAPRRTLAQSIVVELVIVTLILGLVAIWRFTPPPRTFAAAADGPAHVHIHTAAAMADVTFEPGRAGIVRASISLLTGDFAALDAKEVLLTLENKAAGIEAISRPATRGSDAVWYVEQIPVPVGGRWEVRVDVLVSDFEKRTLDGQVTFKDAQ